MALINPSSLYSGGNVALDSTPSTNLYGQLLARKQAKMQALDQYDQQRINSVNGSGVRDRDREGFDTRLNELRNYYNQNKDSIRKGTTPQAYEYEKMFRNIGSYINQSKERTAKQDAAMKLHQERFKQDGVVPDDFITAIEANDRGIDEEGSATFDLNKWLSSPKPFNQDSFKKGFADIKRNVKETVRENVPDDPLKVREIPIEKFDKEGLGVIANRSADKYENSFSFRTQVQNEVKDPIRRGELAKKFQDVYGINPSIPEDYATAYALELIQDKIAGKPTLVTNETAKADRSEAFRLKTQAISEAGKNSRFYAGLNRQRPGLGDYDILSLYDPKVQEIEIETPAGKDFLGRPKTEKKKVTVLYKKDIDGNDEKYFEGATPYRDKNDQPYYIQRSDGDYEGNGGKVIQRTTAAIKFMGNPAAYKGGVLTKEPVTRLPKNIKDTKIAPRPTRPKPY